jgi:hypothetical protein
MKRRSFVKTAALAGTGVAMLPSLASAEETIAERSDSQFYELRVYAVSTPAQQALVETYLRQAYLPALNKLNIKTIGVFTTLPSVDNTRIFVLIPYSSLDQFNKASTALEHDAEYQQQGAAYLNAPASAPAYQRIESSLLRAFSHMPKLVTPEAKPRMFELRQYQSASEAAGKKKIEMFNDRGEIDIFKRLGFNPVFFAETIIGPQRPNLTYMVTFDDMAAHDAHWKAFGGDPEWKKISSVPEYADALLVSKITSTYIIPTAYSQI